MGDERRVIGDVRAATFYDRCRERAAKLRRSGDANGRRRRTERDYEARLDAMLERARRDPAFVALFADGDCDFA